MSKRVHVPAMYVYTLRLVYSRGGGDTTFGDLSPSREIILRFGWQKNKNLNEVKGKKYSHTTRAINVILPSIPIGARARTVVARPPVSPPPTLRCFPLPQPVLRRQ